MKKPIFFCVNVDLSERVDDRNDESLAVESYGKFQVKNICQPVHPESKRIVQLFEKSFLLNESW